MHYVHTYVSIKSNAYYFMLHSQVCMYLFGNLIDICNKHKHEKQWKNSEKFPHELVRTHITPIERFYDLL